MLMNRQTTLFHQRPIFDNEGYRYILCVEKQASFFYLLSGMHWPITNLKPSQHFLLQTKERQHQTIITTHTHTHPHTRTHQMDSMQWLSCPSDRVHHYGGTMLFLRFTLSSIRQHCPAHFPLPFPSPPTSRFNPPHPTPHHCPTYPT